MQKESPVVVFDNYGAFEIMDQALVMEVPPGLLSAVGGGTDLVCDNNGACGNTIDVGCVNVTCHPNFNDVACVQNGACIG